ncbi:MAG: GIY-YIG nuclease family protein [bacterium]|nr:GIY-YIG nuclease family protein [bacterium]
MNSYYVYITASQRNGTLYTGVTNNLMKRIYEHKNAKPETFTGKYLTNRLVYFEETASIEEAIKREKQIKNWKRKWKLDLIEENNPEWEDLYDKFLDSESSSE